MIALIAQGRRPAQRHRILRKPGEQAIIGRSFETDLPIPWDPAVSRVHVRLSVDDSRVRLERMPESRNPVYRDGEEVESATLSPGDRFVIGSTTVFITAANVDPSDPVRLPIEQFTFDPDELRKVRFVDANQRIEVLAQLPDLIRRSRVDAELHGKLAQLLLEGISSAAGVAIVHLSATGEVDVLHSARQQGDSVPVEASVRLVRQAMRSSGRTVLHVWENTLTQTESYTQSAEFDWAFCSPVIHATGGAWGIYVAGSFDASGVHAGSPDSGQVRADVRFTEFVAEIITTVERENRWERQKTALQQFLPPPVLDALGDELDTALLEPRECEITVLFCDLRGFTRQAEEAADNLLELLGRVSSALELMTIEILGSGGVTGDFQGDAALGFWGWPFASDDAPLNACRAALAIRSAFESLQQQPEHPLRNFRVGIGLAHGRGVAGKIGTSEQVKATVFGPVVNLASRLESMTKELRVPILLDEAAANLVREKMPVTEGRIRKLARVRPFGMESTVEVSELMPPAGTPGVLTDQQISVFEAGVDDFLSGEWESAYQRFHSMPASDLAQDFLSVLIAQHNRIAPPEWDGIIRLKGK